MAKITVDIQDVNKSKGQIMNGEFFKLIQDNFAELATKTGQINQFGVLDNIEEVDVKQTNSAALATAINGLLADLKAKGYMKTTRSKNRKR